MPKLAAALLFLAAAVPAGAALPTYQDLGALDQMVAETLGAGIGQPGGATAPVDRRLKLAACPAATVEPPVAGAATVRCAALGWRLRVPVVRDGAAVPSFQAAAVRAAPVVRRGDPIEMMVDTGSFSVSVQAIADQDGAPGDRIRVRSDGKSGSRIAEVVDAGRVKIAGFK